MPQHDIIIVGIDFDGTLCDHRFPSIGEEAPHAIRVLHCLRQFDNVRLMLWTMRSDGQPRARGARPLADAVQWCADRGIAFWGVNSNPDQHSWTSSPKQYAHVYIDDAAIGCPLIHPPGFSRPCVDWKTLAPQLLERLRSLGAG